MSMQARIDIHTLPEWCTAVERLGALPSSVDVMELAQALSKFDSLRDAEDVRAVLPMIAQLLAHAARDPRQASLLDAIGAALAKHTAVLTAAHANREVLAHIDSQLEGAALDDETYKSGKCCAQMATAQLKLRRYCAAFWRCLERRGLQHQQPRTVATVVHRAAALLEEVNAPPPSAALWAAMEVAMTKHAPGMSAQQVSNCIFACAKLERQPGGELARKLLSVAENQSTSMEPQNVGNVLWALAKLSVPVKGTLRAALAAAAIRTSGRMNAHTVANVLWSLATLRVTIERSLRAVLLAAALRTSADMTSQDVPNTLHARAGRSAS